MFKTVILRITKTNVNTIQLRFPIGQCHKLVTKYPKLSKATTRLLFQDYIIFLSVSKSKSLASFFQPQSWIFKPSCITFMKKFPVLCVWPSSPIQSSCLACTAFVFTACKGFKKPAEFEKPYHVPNVGGTSGSLEAVILTLCRQIFESIVCWMCWPSKSATQAASSVGIVTEKAETVRTASNVVRSGVTTVYLCIMASEPIKNIMRWLWKTFKMKTLRTF